MMEIENVVNTLKMCYDDAKYLSNDRYLVFIDNNYYVVDSNGQVIKTLGNNIFTTKNLIFRINNVGTFNLVDNETLEIASDNQVPIGNILELKSGILIININGRFGILNANGRVIAPIMYSHITVLEDNTEGSKLYIMYPNENEFIKFVSKVDKYGNIHNLGELDFSNTQYQMRVVNFKDKDKLISSNEYTSKHFYTAFYGSIEEDKKTFGLKFKLANFGTVIGKNEYDTIIYDRVLKDNGYFMVGNRDTTNRANYLLGIIDKRGKELIKTKYNSIKYMGNKIFACYNGDHWEIVSNNGTHVLNSEITNIISNSQIPLIVALFKDGHIEYLGNDYNLHNNIVDAAEIYKYSINGVVYDINKVCIYGNYYITDNSLNIIGKELTERILDKDEYWISLKSLS